MTQTLTPTQTRVLKVLERIEASVRDDEDTAEMYSEALQAMLSELNSQDAFGSEGQCDPRGDFRNGNWSMSQVEDVDG